MLWIGSCGHDGPSLDLRPVRSVTHPAIHSPTHRCSQCTQCTPKCTAVQSSSHSSDSWQDGVAAEGAGLSSPPFTPSPPPPPPPPPPVWVLRTRRHLTRDPLGVHGSVVFTKQKQTNYPPSSCQLLQNRQFTRSVRGREGHSSY